MKASVTPAVTGWRGPFKQKYALIYHFETPLISSQNTLHLLQDTLAGSCIWTDQECRLTFAAGEGVFENGAPPMKVQTAPRACLGRGHWGHCGESRTASGFSGIFPQGLGKGGGCRPQAFFDSVGVINPKKASLECDHAKDPVPFMTPPSFWATSKTLSGERKMFTELDKKKKKKGKKVKGTKVP